MKKVIFILFFIALCNLSANTAKESIILATYTHYNKTVNCIKGAQSFVLDIAKLKQFKTTVAKVDNLNKPIILYVSYLDKNYKTVLLTERKEIRSSDGRVIFQCSSVPATAQEVSVTIDALESGTVCHLQVVSCIRRLN